MAWLVLVATACGGSTKPAEEPSAPAESETPAASDPDPESAGEEAPKSSAAESTSSESVSEDDRRAIYQALIEDDELGNHLHLATPGRFPLKISGKDLPTGLTKTSKPVEYIASPEAKAPVLVFTEEELTKNKAIIKYRYDAEGIGGTTTVTRGDHGWEVFRVRIVEHFRPDAK